MTTTSEIGVVLRDGDEMVLQFQRRFDKPIHDVWRALTAPEEVAKWFGEYTGDPTTGRVSMMMTAEEEAEPSDIEIVECAAPNRLAVISPSEDGPWPLSATLESDDDGTLFTFRHIMAEPFDANSIGPGWQFYLDRLAAVVNGTDVPSEWDAYYPALKDSYPIPTS